MSNINNPVAMEQLLEFKIIFPDEKSLEPEEYLKGGSKSVILNVASFFLGFKTHESKFRDNKVLLGSIFGRENYDFAGSINDKINKIEKEGKKILIVNPYTSLTLFELFFSKEEEPETQTHAEFEVNLFKAYLVLNSKFTEKQNIAISSTKKLDEEERIPMMMFCTDYPISDKIHYDIDKFWVTQIIKSIYLFQFLESNEKTKYLLQEYIKYFNKSSWQDYLRSLISLTMAVIKKDGDAETYTDIIVNQENFEEDCSFIEKFIIEDGDGLNENDFLTLRAKPLYKIEKGKYRIIFDLFVAEKIFKGAYFLFRDINNKLPVEHKISEFKSFYGKEFSEKILAYKVIESIYTQNCIKFSGQELDDMKIDGAPDYYIRKNKNILLFESKDFLIRADKKSSFDFEVYEQEFERVLYYEIDKNGKEKYKAVMQLITNVKALLQTKFAADKDYKYKDVYIYPILLTHDHQYDTFGFNRLIDSWFQEELEALEQERIFIHYVKPLTVINIDTLIFYQKGLIENIALTELIDEYHKHIDLRKKVKFKTRDEAQQYVMAKYISFATFANNYFSAKKINKIPSILDIVKPALFGENQE
jgi:hypothetical protein